MEIQKILSSRGANKFVIDYEEGIPSSLTFSINMNDRLIFFSLPANYSGVLRAMKADKKVQNRYCKEDQAIRTSWRIVKDWVEAQMALIDAELADLAEVFLPYAITKSGKRLYEDLSDTNYLLEG